MSSSAPQDQKSAASVTSMTISVVAMLGGFLARKGDGEPGVKTLWLGLQRVVDFAAGIRFAREAHAL